MLQRELAEALDISPAMVSKLVKRGMPVDSLERAQRWRKRHLEPGRVKAFKAPGRTATQQTIPPQPSRRLKTQEVVHAPTGQPISWLDMAAPQTVSVWMVEVLAAACLHILKYSPNPNDAAYALAFLRDLLRRADSHEVGFVLPLGVWLRLVDHWIHPEVIARLKLSPCDKLINATTLGQMVNPDWPMPSFELLDAAADAEGISVIGWHDDGQDAAKL